MGKIFVVNYRFVPPDGARVINTTSRSPTASKYLSPFYCGPCKLYDSFISQNVENGWQYSKVYSEHTDSKGDPTDEYFKWAKQGWEKVRADRYPAGKGRKPEYVWWGGEKLGYIEARKRVYVPLYSDAVVRTGAFARLQREHKRHGTIYLVDFDAHNHDMDTVSLNELLDNPSIKVGHAYVLADLLLKG